MSYRRVAIVFGSFPLLMCRTDGMPVSSFEENARKLFCSDLFHQWGHREPATDKDILQRCEDALRETEAGPFANYVPYTHHTGRVLESLAEQERRHSRSCTDQVITVMGHRHCETWLS